MKIAPSILAANFSELGSEIREVEAAGADYIHIDVMDGHFVPNISMGPFIVETVRSITALPLDVHLMISDPDRYIDAFAKAGADMITVHAEATPHLHRTLQAIKAHGKKAGIVLNPGTPASVLKYVLQEADMVLIMTVNPGFGGQKFIEAAVSKITEVRELAEKLNHPVEIEVDGGIDAATAKICRDAGADVFVAGSAIFGQKDRHAAIEKIRRALAE